MGGLYVVDKKEIKMSLQTTSRSRWHTLLTSFSTTLLLVACGNEPATDVREDAVNAAFERGHHILYNAKTRYEYPEAIELLEQAIIEDADDAAAHLALIYAYTKRGEYDKASIQITSVKALRDLLDEKDQLWLDALDARVADRPALECERWRDIVDLYPQDRWAWYELSASYLTIGGYQRAADAAAKALEIETNAEKWEASWIYYLQSKSLFRSGQYEAAADAAAVGRENASTWRSTYYRMALAQIRAGDKDVAENFVAEYREISNTEGRNDAAYTEANIALFYFELADYEKAIEHASTADELSPSAYTAWVLAYALVEDGRGQEGLTVAEAAASSFPDDNHLLTARGWALYRLGQFEAARAMLTEAESAAPRSQHYLRQMLDIVEAAISDPENSSEERIPWLG